MILLVLGTALILVTALEIIATITMAGGGPVAVAIPWLLSRVLQDRHGRWRVRPRPWLGMAKIIATVLLWFVLLWLGWLLVFASSPQAVIETSSGEPAPFWARVYFSGFAVSTLGVGDYRPGGPLWQVLTAVSSLSSFFLLTLTISFFVPMVQGEMQRRRLALLIHHLGSTPQDFLSNCYHAERAEPMPALSTLVPMLVALEQVHRRYPALHFSGSRARQYALVLAIATLDEALTLRLSLSEAAPDEHVRAARRAVHGLLASMEEIFIQVSDEVPPLPDVTSLRRAGLSLPGAAELSGHFAQYAERRRQLKTLVAAGGWAWEDVERTADEPLPVRLFTARQ